MSDTKHTIHSIGEKLNSFHGEFKALGEVLGAKRAETKTDEGLAWWRKSHWSALIGLMLLIAAMVVGDILGIARGAAGLMGEWQPIADGADRGHQHTG